ncbi:MAG: hypothetical protein AAB307_00330, partial [Deltaproteobacteria bacterium]
AIFADRTSRTHGYSRQDGEKIFFIISFYRLERVGGRIRPAVEELKPRPGKRRLKRKKEDP